MNSVTFITLESVLIYTDQGYTNYSVTLHLLVLFGVPTEATIYADFGVGGTPASRFREYLSLYIIY